MKVGGFFFDFMMITQSIQSPELKLFVFLYRGLSYLCVSIRCKNGMNHLRDRIPHMADGLCQFAHQYNNKVLICKVRRQSHTELYVHFLSSSPLHFAFICSGAMKEAERWLLCQKHQLPLTIRGLDWLNMPGQGEWAHIHSLWLPVSQLSRNVLLQVFSSSPLSGMCWSVPAVGSSTAVGSTGWATRTLKAAWCDLRSNMSGRMWVRQSGLVLFHTPIGLYWLTTGFILICFDLITETIL